MGKGQDEKKKYVTHLLFKQSALCVIFSLVLNSTCLSRADFTAQRVATDERGPRSKNRDGTLNGINHHGSDLQALVGARALDYLFSEECLSS